MCSILLVQSLFFADGGLSALGCNIFNMGFLACFAAYPIANKVFKNKFLSSFFASVLALQFGSIAVGIEGFLSGSIASMSMFTLLMCSIHLAIGVVEGIFTGIICYIAEKTDLSKAFSYSLGGLSLLLSGIIANYASTKPDGLEWSLLKMSDGFTAQTQGQIYALSQAIQSKTAILANLPSVMANLLGLAIIIPLAMSVQALNRKMTRNQFHAKGAPIYKDFGKKNTHKDLSPKEEQKFFMQKCISAAGMVGLALLSMMKKPTMKMFQFKGMFPTVDQCRVIACSTFASRMFAAEDKNELRETTVRDVASFSGLYFLGDYVAKGVATAIEKVNPNVKLLNVVKESAKTDSAPKKFWNWVKNVHLKSFDEISGAGAKNLRSLCQIASIGFSIAFLGIALPRYNRSVTEKKVAKQKALEEKMKLEAQKAKSFDKKNTTIDPRFFQSAIKAGKTQN